MTGWFELCKNEKGEFWFVLKAANDEIILRSEQYTTKAAAQNGIASVQTNSPLPERYESKVAANGAFFFNLKAANHQAIGTSQMYKTESGRDNGIESVKKNGSTPLIREV